MTLPPDHDHRIPLAEAADLTRRHRQAAGDGGPVAFAFRREAFEAILAQSGCAGIRAYLGRGKDGAARLVLVGLNAEGNDLAAGEVMDRSWPCPPFCDAGGALSG